MQRQEKIVVDTSVLINFLRIDRMDLIGKHPAPFITTKEVADEITDASQKSQYEAAISGGYLAEEGFADDVEHEMFLGLSKGTRLGIGECSVIAVALNRNHKLGMDDERAINHAIQSRISRDRVDIVRTRDIVVELIRHRELTTSEADKMLADWTQNHRFALKIQSFHDLL